MSTSPTAPTNTLFFDSWHREHGARLMTFAGYQMPANYREGIVSECRACRSALALFDVSHMGQCAIEGEAALDLIGRLCPSDIADQAIGSMRYTVFLYPDGGIMDDAILTRTEKGCRIVVNASRKLVIIDHLASNSVPNVTVNWLDDRVLLALQGPNATEVLKTIFPKVDLAGLGFMQSLTIDVGSEQIWCSRCGYTGEDGFELSIPNSLAEGIMNEINQDERVKPAGLGARDVLRLEAGLPLYGQDIDESRSPIEANLTWVIPKSRRQDSTFIGSSRVQRELQDKTRMILRGFRFEGRQPVRSGAKITHLTDTFDEKDVIGHITSGTFSPDLGPIALGYVERGLKLNEPVTAWQRGKAFKGHRHSVPFVPHQYYRLQNT